MSINDDDYLCAATDGIAECEVDSGSLMPQLMLFVAQLIAGIGQTLCSTLVS